MACSPVGLISSMDRVFLPVIAMIRVRFPIAVADPDPEITGGGGGGGGGGPPKNSFLRIMGARPSRTPPLNRPLSQA